MAVRLDELVLPGFVFVQEHSEEKKLYVRPTGKLLSVTEAALLKTELQPFLAEQQAKASDSAVVQLCDRPYHIVYYVMNNDISRK